MNLADYTFSSHIICIIRNRLFHVGLPPKSHSVRALFHHFPSLHAELGWLADVTLAVEDSNSLLDDNANCNIVADADDAPDVADDNNYANATWWSHL